MGIYQQAPFPAVFLSGEPEHHRLIIGVENKDEIVIFDLVPVDIGFRYGMAVEEDHQRQGIGIVPVLLVHNRTRMVEPFYLRRIIAFCFRIKELAAVEYGMLQPQMDHFLRKIVKLLAPLIKVPMCP